jgi:peroxiredoxin
LLCKKSKEVTKKTIWAITVLLFAVVLTTYGIISYDKPGNTLLIKEKTDSPEIDRLLRDMGVTKVPNLAPPVDFNLLDINGNKIVLSGLKGKIVFLNFWATWCSPCREEMPSMQKLYARFKDKDFAMVAVSLNEPASAVKKFFKDYNLTFTALLDSDGELMSPYGIRGIPNTFIIDRDGTIIGKAFGPRKWDDQKAIALFEHLINKT